MNEDKINQIFGSIVSDEQNDSDDNVKDIVQNTQNNLPELSDSPDSIENQEVSVVSDENTYDITEADEIRNDDQTENEKYIDAKLKDIIEQTTSGSANILELAKISESPRAFEVYGGILKTQIDAIKELADIEKAKRKQETKKETANSAKNQTQINIGNDAVTSTNINKILQSLSAHKE